MGKDLGLSELVAQARLGNKESMDQLAQLAEPRLRAFIHRITLDEELTGDLLQEALLQMVESLSSLQKAESFWPWVFRIASSKTNQFFRTKKRVSAVQFSTLEDSLLESILRDDSHEASSSVVRRELGQLIVEAAAKLKHRQRAIVSLRCFEGLPYSEIAQAVGCSEVDARVSFFRAKQSLKKQLSRRGFSKSSLLLGLVLFGKLTAPSEAAALSITVSPGILKGIGVPAMLLGVAKSRWAEMSAAVAGIFIVTFACWYFWPAGVLNRVDVRNAHFIVQGVMQEADSSSSSSSSAGDGQGTDFITWGAYETWMNFPEGPDGPVIRRDQRWNIQQTAKQCSWLQDGKANYYYHSGQKAIYITNDPLGLLLLPTDLPNFVKFILEMCNHDPRLEYIRNKRNGLLTGKIDNRVPTVEDFKTTYEYNTLEEKVFEYNWPRETKVVDKRDAMHKRGWTYFRITGRIGNNDISGRGRIPFVYAACNEHWPWLQLQIAGGISITDGSSGAYLLDGSGAVLAHYPAGSFFKGLARPWMGIRAYDIVRRDAAEKRIPFEFEQAGKRGQVTLCRDEEYMHKCLAYFIDMQKDIIEGVSFSISGGPEMIEGALQFSYLEDIDQAGDDFAEPGPIDCQLPPRQAMGVCWLLKLAEGTLGEVGERQ